MKTCFVSMPFGKKSSVDGAIIDYDFVYQALIKPTVQSVGLECIRAEAGLDLDLQKTIMSNIITSDVMIADISTFNPNVLYELGIRHALAPQLTFLIAQESTQIPFDLNSFQVLFYSINKSEKSATTDNFRLDLKKLLISGIEYGTTDSPVHRYYPDIQINLPSNLTKIKNYPKDGNNKLLNIKKKLASTDFYYSGLQNIRDAHAEIVKYDLDFESINILLRAYRRNSAWEDIIRLYEELPVNYQKSPEVISQVALALNRRKSPEDQKRAILLLTTLIERHEGNSETFGILGKIYKDLYFLTLDRKYFEESILAYLEGLSMDSSSYYNGLNALSLLMIDNTKKSRDKIKVLLPNVKNILFKKMDDGKFDFWDIASVIELYCIEGEWEKAFDASKQLVNLSKDPTMLLFITNNLEKYNKSLSKIEKSHLKRVVNILNSGGEALRGA